MALIRHWQMLLLPEMLCVSPHDNSGDWLALLRPGCLGCNACM